MQQLETGNTDKKNGRLCEPLDAVETNKSLNNQSRETDENTIRLNGDSEGMVYGEDRLTSAKQEVISPPIKARKRFLKSTEELSSTSQEEGKYNSSKTTKNFLQHTDYIEYHLSNQKNIFPVINCPERLFKIIFLGDSGVGKTSFIHRFCCDKFLSTYHSTLGIDYQVKTFAVHGRLIALQLWDTAGQERYRSITRQYFHKTDGIIFMYDVTSELSFRNVRNWMAYVKENSGNNLVFAIVGNKIDLSQKKIPIVTTANGEELAKKHESLFHETSCRTGEGVWNVMSQMACALQLKEDREIERTRKFPKVKESKKCC